jgi:hypothetical protein
MIDCNTTSLNEVPSDIQVIIPDYETFRLTAQSGAQRSPLEAPSVSGIGKSIAVIIYPVRTVIIKNDLVGTAAGTRTVSTAVAVVVLAATTSAVTDILTIIGSRTVPVRVT